MKHSAARTLSEFSFAGVKSMAVEGSGTSCCLRSIDGGMPCAKLDLQKDQRV